MPLLLNAQTNRVIHGTVTIKKTNEALAGVNVFIPGSTKGTTTNADGKYEIPVTATDRELQFSFIGFISETKDITGQNEVNAELTEDIHSLEDVVVVGFGTQKKSDLTGAISTVNIKEINQRAVATLDQALQGQVAGVDVTTNSGTPGSNMMIRVRGVGTINNSDPLFVVDGMMLNDINFLNPNDIETLQVLKDASATAIYGSRGANGVIIITTKKGKSGDGNVSFSSYYGIQNPWRSSNMLDGPTWGYLSNEAAVATGQEPLFEDPSKLPTYNYFEAICEKNAPVKKNDLSFSGGSDKGTYFLSASQFAQNGIIKKTGFERITLRANSDFNVKPWLKIGENITLVKTNYKSQYENDEWTSPILTSFTRDPVTPPLSDDGKFNKAIYSDIWNPLAVIEYDNPRSINYRGLGNIFADITLFKGLIFRTNISAEYSNVEYSNYTPVYYVFAAQQNPNKSNLTNSTSSSLINQWSNTLTYEKKIGGHYFSVMAGGESYSQTYKSLGVSVQDIPSNDPNLFFIDNAIGKNAGESSGITTRVKQLSGLARINYNFKERYLLTANFRADGSSKFVRGKRWDYFPSFSVGWRLSEEPFMEQYDKIDNLKLRAGWGRIGNEQSVIGYQYSTFASPDANYVWGGVLTSGFSFNGTGNPQLKWETTETINAGIDFEFFKGKISGSIDYFKKITDNMLLRVPTPGQAGLLDSPFQNKGKFSNKGVELSLQYRNYHHAFTYTISGTLSKIVNKVLDLGADNAFIDGAFFYNTVYLTRTQAGTPIAQFFGYKTDGLFQNWEEVNAQTAQEGVAPGDVKYVDKNNDNVLDARDFFILGSPLPKLTYSFTGSCAYKGFDFSCFFQGVYGNKVYNGVSMYTLSGLGGYNNLSRDMIGRWHGEGTQNNPKYPRMGGSMDNNSILQSDRLLEDGSFLRIKNVQIGYTLPQVLTRKIKVDLIRAYINAQNLFTFTKYTGLDPEVGMRNDDPFDVGVDRGYYPPARMYSIGINISL